jgi:hypothetical protein
MFPTSINGDRKETSYTAADAKLLASYIKNRDFLKGLLPHLYSENVEEFITAHSDISLTYEQLAEVINAALISPHPTVESPTNESP